MSDYTEVEQPFLQQLKSLGWEVIDQGMDIPSDPGKSLRFNFCQWTQRDVLPKYSPLSISLFMVSGGSQTRI